MAKEQKEKKERDGIFTRKDRPGRYISYIDEQGKRRKKRVGATSQREAEKMRAFHVTRAEQAKILGITPPTDKLFEEVAEEYLDYQRTHLRSKEEIVRTEGIIKSHVKPRFKARKFADITRNDLEKYVTDRLKAGANPHTVIKEFNKIKRLWTLAVQWKYVPVNIAKGIELPTLPPDRVKWLEKPELPRLLEACAPWLRPIVLFAVGTGMRRSEVLKLRYCDINEALQRAYLYETKNNQSRGVPLTRVAQFALDMVSNPKAGTKDRVFMPITDAEVSRFAKLAGCDQGAALNIRYRNVNLTAGTILIEPTHNGTTGARRRKRLVALGPQALAMVEKHYRPGSDPAAYVFFPINPSKVTQAFMRARELAGLEDFRLHDLRHTFASWLAMDGKPLQVIAEILGHSDVRVTRKYAHLSPLHLQEAARAIDQVFMPELTKPETRFLEEGKGQDDEDDE